MILYFNYQYFTHPTVEPYIENLCGHNAFSYLKNIVQFDSAATRLYNRKGDNFLPTVNNLTNVQGFSMPDRDRNFSQSWEEVTDQRCLDLKKTHSDQPWIVMWSGGIDSTNLVAALIKNLHKSDLENITIACSLISIWENSHFFFNYIKPNFKIINSKEMVSQEFDSHLSYIIDGEPADQLMGGLGVALPVLYQNLDLMHKNVIKHPEHAIEFFSKKTDKNFAEWYYHNIIKNATSAGIDLVTLADMAWWSTFNHSWTSIKFRSLYYGKWKNSKNVKSYIDQFVHWYDSNEYQQWAMDRQNINEKLGHGMSDYKLAAKKYILSVDNNKYYFKFKTKMPSGDLGSIESTPWCCITDDWDLLNLNEHADQIVSLLPYHFIGD